jgi:glycosidase
MLAQIERIEPPFWYAGMRNPELQILIYGKKIAKYSVTTSNAIKITKIEKTENPNYIFVTINLLNCGSQDFFLIFKDNNNLAFTQKYSLKQRRENSADRKSFDASDMLYLLMPDRFSKGNEKNDLNLLTKEQNNRALPAGRHGGDIQGIINHLDYLEELGVTTLWSTPLCEDDDAEYSYHTYGQSDVYKVDPRYGTNEDYVLLSDEIHQRKMKLVMDYVTNHWGIEHWMIKDLPTQDWFNYIENYTETNHKRTVIHDIHASELDKKICIDGWFVPSMPDINIKNPLVLKYLTQNAIWWIEYANLDGFRVDTYNYSDPKGIALWTKSVTDEYPNFNIVGEVWMFNQSHAAYWQKDSKIAAIQNYNSYLPTVMDFTLLGAINSAFNEDEDSWDKGMIKIYDNFTNDFLFPNPSYILTFAENHDTHRINHLFNNDVNKYKMAMGLLATTRGIPQLYYGSEIGMAGNKDQGDAYVRQDFPGGWEGDANNAFTKDGRTEKQNEYFEFTAKLFNWRKNKPVIHFGKMTHYVPENNTYIYFRYQDTDCVMVIINNNTQSQTIKTNRFTENLGKYISGKEIITEKIIDITTEISIEPKSIMILELM